jgi:hypothetical protein
MSRAHELGHLRLTELIAIWQTNTTNPVSLGQATRYGYQPIWNRDRLIAAILNHETQPPEGHQS